VTDAHVVLGTLTAQRTLGGELKLDPDAAIDAVRDTVARPLGVSVEEAASSIIRVADANMASSLRVISVARGLDPRRMTLVALGGAGPMHGCSLAEELDMRKVLVPAYPGVTAAMGLLLTAVRHDLGRSWVRGTATLTNEELQPALDALAVRARDLLSQSGHDESGALTFSADMRYSGQAYSLSIPVEVDADGVLLDEAIASIEVAFAQSHRQAYDYILDDTPMECVALRVSASAPEEPITFAARTRSAMPSMGRRRIWMRGEWQDALILDRSGVGEEPVSGPAVIEQEDTTTLLFPGWTARQVSGGSMLLERLEA
jgi:N-methylhydantoinase A/oxoprolinase/acetone carboxylase beta subunit